MSYYAQTTVKNTSATQKATTEEGRKVILKSDGTWQYIEEEKNKPKEVSWKDMPLVKRKALPRTGTIVFGEKYPDSIYAPEGVIAFRTAQKYSKLIMKVGVQDNENAIGFRHLEIKNESRTLFEVDVLPNRRPKIIEIDISDCDLVGFVLSGFNGETNELIRYMDIRFIPK